MIEKIYEYFFPHHATEKVIETVSLSEADILLVEKDKIKSAIVTDFILSIEIVIIALGTVEGELILNQILVVSFIAILATVGVYGVVALIVRMDDFGRVLKRTKSKIVQATGDLLIKALPKVIKLLAFVGTIALLLVAGGIFSHKIEAVHHMLTSWPDMLKEFVLGIIGGLLAFAVVTPLKKLFKKKSDHASAK